jgi:hypothetical protein
VTFRADQVRAIYYGASPAPQSPPHLAPSARDEALRALKALRSVAEGRTTYRDYARRVSDTKIIVDRYLQEPERSDAELKAAMAEALHFYQLAGTAWEMEITLKEEPTRRVAADPAVARCPAAQSLIDEYRRRDATFSGNAAHRGWTEAYTAAIVLRLVKSGSRPFWVCAGDKLAEAEKLVLGQVR